MLQSILHLFIQPQMQKEAYKFGLFHFVIMQTNINTTLVIIIIYNHYDDYF